MWVYRLTEGGIYTVGFYTPQGEWCTDSDHESKEAAALRVHYLNGGGLTAEDVDRKIDEALYGLQAGGYIPI